jgi:ketosteroid isomerase-like protein
MSESDPRLQQLLDESEIRQVLARYGRAIDAMDFDLLRSCYHPDAIDEHGVYDGDVDGFIDLLRERLPNDIGTNHFIGASLIELDGDTAWVETHALGHHRFAATDDEPLRDRYFFLRYADRFERREGEWRIAHRVVVYEPGRVDPVTQDWPYAEGCRVGIRGVAPRRPLRP